MSDTATLVVFDLESEDAPLALGNYVRTDEDIVIYRSHVGYRAAPCDCVQVVSVNVFMPQAVGA